jgi:hypothetical protein
MTKFTQLGLNAALIVLLEEFERKTQHMSVDEIWDYIKICRSLTQKVNFGKVWRSRISIDLEKVDAENMSTDFKWSVNLQDLKESHKNFESC